jgi:beta-galactosidase
MQHDSILMPRVGAQEKQNRNRQSSSPIPKNSISLSMNYPLTLVMLSFLFRLAGGPAAGAAVEAQAGGREQLTMADGWRFHEGSIAGAEVAAFDDLAWEAVTLPHTWNAKDGNVPGFYQGDGWYRRCFQVPASWEGKRVYLQFDGANRSAEVFLNGHRLGLHRGGTARFRFDATSALNGNGANVLAVRVNNDPHDNMAPVSADFTFFGGLYRAVSLVATDPVHIDMLDHAAPGVYVRQKQVSVDAAELELQVKLANDTETAADVTVRTTISEANGTPVQTVETRASLAALARGETGSRLVLTHPHLWNGQADPYIYRVRTEVLVAGGVRDVVTLPLGLRFFSVDPAHGFSLNGRYLDLHGVNRHQDRPGKGWAISEADEREDFAMIEEIGATFVRQSHYQQSQLWDDLGDQRGMMMWAELGYVNDARDNREFFENAKEQLRELIRQNLHHASILFWSIGNETFVRNTKVMPADTNDRLLRELAAVVREEDPSRLSTYASNGDVSEPRAGISDVVGFNKYFGWYGGNPDEFATWADAQHAARPDLRMGISEYGAGANVAQHEEPARKPVANSQWHPEEWQAAYHEVHWQAMARRPWLWGKLVWCMFDFASAGRNEGATPGRNDKGLVTADRTTRKDAFYWYQANWSAQPVLHITSQRFTPRTQPVTAVKIYSNAEAVELRINGVSLGSKTSANHIFLWPGVTLKTGRNAITASATRGGHDLTDNCEWDLHPTSP